MPIFAKTYLQKILITIKEFQHPRHKSVGIQILLFNHKSINI